MDHTPETTNDSAAEATLEERVDALEMLVQHLVLVLETEPAFTGSALERWLAVVAERMRLHNAATPRQLAALGRLRLRVAA